MSVWTWAPCIIPLIWILIPFLDRFQEARSMNVVAVPMSRTHWLAVEVVVPPMEANRLWGGAGQESLKDIRNASRSAGNPQRLISGVPTTGGC